MICKRCGVTAESGDGSGLFYPSLPRVCKECHRAQMRSHYQTPGYRTKNAGYQRARLKDKENYAKHDARLAVRWALKTGEMIRGSNCALCNSDQDIEAHHRDYSKKLEVVWLCRNCHATYHAGEAGKQRQVKDKGMSIPRSSDDITHSIHYAILTKTE